MSCVTGELLYTSVNGKLYIVRGLGLATNPESTELLKPDEIRNPPPLSNAPSPRSAGSDTPKVPPEPEAEVNALPLPILFYAETEHVQRVRTMSLPRMSLVNGKCDVVLVAMVHWRYYEKLCWGLRYRGLCWEGLLCRKIRVTVDCGFVRQ